MTGNGIESIDKTSTVGLVDTYTITYTDGTTTTFTVTNGEDGEVTQAQFDALQQEVEDQGNNQIILDATPSTSLYLTDSASAKNRGIGITGRKEQESTTGKQLFDYSKVKNTLGGDLVNGSFLENYDNGVLVKGNQNDEYTFGNYNLGWYVPGSSNQSAAARITVEEETTLYISADVTLKELYKSDFNRMNIYLYGTSQYTSVIWTPLTLNVKRRLVTHFTVQPGTYYPAFTLSGNTFLIENIMVSKSDDTSYEKYTGGTASPNPEYPQTIYNTGDEGVINEKVQNRNLLKIQKDLHLIMNSNGTISSGSASNICQIIDVTNINNLTFNGDFSLTDYQTIRVGLTNDFPAVGVQGTRVEVKPSNKTVDTSNYKYVLCTFVSTGGSIASDIEKSFQIEQGSTATDYVPHEEQVINFPLQPGQNFYEGDYLADDGVHHVESEVVLDGTETWWNQWGTDGSTYVRMTNKIASNTERHASPTTDIICASNKYIAVNFDGGGNSLWNLRDNDNYPYLIAINDKASTAGSLGGAGYLMIKDKRFNTIADWKAYLAEQYANGTPVKVQYNLQTEVIDAYTSEQQVVYDQIKALRTYKGGTHIDSSNNVKPTVDLKYVADTKLYIDNKIATLTNS